MSRLLPTLGSKEQEENSNQAIRMWLSSRQCFWSYASHARMPSPRQGPWMDTQHASCRERVPRGGVPVTYIVDFELFVLIELRWLTSKRAKMKCMKPVPVLPICASSTSLIQKPGCDVGVPIF